MLCNILLCNFNFQRTFQRNFSFLFFVELFKDNFSETVTAICIDKVIILDETDNTLKEIIDLSGFLLKGYIDFYKDKFEFSHPAFVYIPEKGFSIKIGIREKKIRKQVDNV